MQHTIITIDIASYGKIDPSKVGDLAMAINDDVWQSKAGDEADEWKITVKQVASDGSVTDVPGWRIK